MFHLNGMLNADRPLRHSTPSPSTPSRVSRSAEPAAVIDPFIVRRPDAHLPNLALAFFDEDDVDLDEDDLFDEDEEDDEEDFEDDLDEEFDEDLDEELEGEDDEEDLDEEESEEEELILAAVPPRPGPTS